MMHNGNGALAPVSSDAIDIAEVAHSVRAEWRAVAAFLALGVLGAVAVILFAPRRFDGEATLLARSQSGSAASILGRVAGGAGDLLGGIGGLGSASSVETEVQILKSRALAERVVDSLRLQFIVAEPARIAPAALVAHASLKGSFTPSTFQFRRRPDGSYEASGGPSGKPHVLVPGVPGELEIGSITLARELPSTFTLQVLDTEDAIKRLDRKLTVTKAGGEVIRIKYRGNDSVTAAGVPNALVAFYLERRRTTDRGVNARRVEFVTRQMDSLAAELTAKERALREQQEASQVLDAEIVGRAELEGAAELRTALTQAMVDEAAVKQILQRAEQGTLKARDLAAYPAFQKSTGSNPLVAQLGELETKRTELLERRMPNDPEVRALDQSIASLDSTIAGMTATYAQSVTLQRAQMQTEYDKLLSSIGKLPEAAERGGRLKRDVLRLTQLYSALQAQLVEARLGEIGEGGDIRQIDVAAPPREPAFPRTLLTLGVGTAGGLMAGLVAALIVASFGRWFREPRDIERYTGLTAQRFQENLPLLVGSSVGARTMLVVPLDRHARTDVVAQGLARTATARAARATVLDLSRGAGGPGSMVSASDPTTHNVSALIDQLEQQYEMVVVQLPAFASDETIAALRESRPVLFVASSTRVERASLTNALNVLRRMGVPCAGVVMSGESPEIRSRSLI